MSNNQSTLNLRLKLPAISVNKMYYAHKKICTREYNEWRQRALIMMQPYKQEIELFRAEFDPKKHVYTVDLIFGVHSKSFYTKAETVSSLSMDISNCEKGIIDVLFLPKHNNVTSNLNVDDKFLQRMSSEKIPTDGWYIDITVKIKEKP